MPSFTSFAIKTLLEPTSKIVSSADGTAGNPHRKQPNNPDSAAESKSGEGLSSRPNHLYIASPALYTTPDPKPIPPGASAQSVTPSPYIFNRKRRDVQSSSSDLDVSADRRVDGFEVEKQLDDGGGGESSSPRNCGPDDSAGEENLGTSDGEALPVNLEEKEGEDCGDFEEVFDCEEARSVASSSDVDDFAKQTIMSPKSVVFFDADEEFFSDGSVSNMSSFRISNLESELNTSRLALCEEIERRKAAEAAVNRMCTQWQRIGRKLSESGLTFPTPIPGGNSLEIQTDSVEQLIQELVVTRFVYEAIGMEQARAEAEVAVAAVIESKNQEISRLRDRLQYYETVNQEMSHRNLEVAEIARRQREKRRQRRWLWGCIGMSVAVGASVIAYSYLPRASADPFPPITGDSDPSPTSSLPETC